MQMGHCKLFLWEVRCDKEADKDFPAWLIQTMVPQNQLFPVNQTKNCKEILLWEKKYHFITHRSYRKITYFRFMENNSDFCFYSVLEYFHRIYVKYSDCKVLTTKWGVTEKHI